MPQCLRCAGTQRRRATHVVFGRTHFIHSEQRSGALALSFYALSTSQSVSFIFCVSHTLDARTLVMCGKEERGAKRKIHLLLHRNKPARLHQITHFRQSEFVTAAACVSLCCAPDDAFFTRFFEQVLKMWDTHTPAAAAPHSIINILEGVELFLCDAC